MALTRVDHVAIAVHDLDAPLRFYGDVLGLPVLEHSDATPVYRGDTADTPLDTPGRKLFLPAGKSAIALLEATDGSGLAEFVNSGGEGVHHLCFESDGETTGGRLLDRDEHLGLGIATVAADQGVGIRESTSAAGVECIDHVVIASGDSGAAAAHFSDRLGVEIKRTMVRPGTSAQLAFAKLHDVILEFAGPPEPRPGPVRAKYWGIVFTVADIHAAVARTRDAGLRCDDPKVAIQPGAMIAGVKESTGGVPFAFIQYNAVRD